MARFLTDAERVRLATFPDQGSEEDLATHYTLTTEDLAVVRYRRGDANRFGFALQLCTLRFLGFVPEDLAANAPAAVVGYLSDQLGIAPHVLVAYGTRDQTRTEHLTEAMTMLGFRNASSDDLSRLDKWLLERALEHDKPMLLFQLAAEHLRAAKVVRPGVTVIERLVLTAREQAERTTYRRLAGLLTDERMTQLDALLAPDAEVGSSRFAWLCKGATSAKPRAILNELDKLKFIRDLGAGEWDISTLNPNRIKFLAQLARRSTAQALQRATVERRMSVLVAFLSEGVWQFTDEIVDLFDRTLFSYHPSAKGDLDEAKRANAKAANEKVLMFSRLVRVLLDESVADSDVRATVYRELPADELERAAQEADRLARPADDNYFDFLLSRYGQARRFTPEMLAALDLRSSAASANVLRGIEVLRQLDKDGKRRVPKNAPLAFVPARWRPYVVGGNGQINRNYWELCLLSELRGALRSGDVWLTSSRRYANPETYLIPRERWPSMCAEACAMLGAAANGVDRLTVCEAKLSKLLQQLDQTLAAGAAVRIEDGELVITPLSAEELPEDSKQLRALVAERLPKVELAELLIEVDRWCGFAQHLTHASGATSRIRNLPKHLYAAVLAQACNFGLSNMAEVADISARQLAWTAEWHLREETLKAATVAVINYQHRLPLSQVWGGGTLSSSDGQRFPVAVKSNTARALPRYFGFGRGLTFYTWTSDQFSQYGTKVISSTVRDATYVLDGLLDNETELQIVEHTTDTAGYSDLVFALFDLLGLQFAPRIRDLGDHVLYRLGPIEGFQHAGPLLRGTIDRKLIVDRWDDLLRVAASLKLGWVSSSLLISRLQASPRKNSLTKALQEYGRVAKTMFALRYLESEDYRRRINLQLNKGESLHALRGFLFFAEEARIRRRQLDDQIDQANCLNLVTNAVIAWNTVYIAEVLRQLRDEGRSISPEAIAHLSPAMYAHINRYGKYSFDVDQLPPGELRPLRAADA